MSFICPKTPSEVQQAIFTVPWQLGSVRFGEDALEGCLDLDRKRLRKVAMLAVTGRLLLVKARMRNAKLRTS